MALGTLFAALWLAQASPGAPPEAAPPVTPPEAPAPQAAPPAPPAQPEPPAPPAPPLPPRTPSASAPPSATASFPPEPRRGFQGALSVQYAAPGGRVQGDLHVRDLVQALVELEAQAGVKVTRRWFVGGYLAGGVGAPGRDTATACDDFDRTCVARSGRIGVLGRYDLTPGDPGNLWFGVGLGAQRQRADVAVRTATGLTVDRADLTGSELRILAGVDYRATRVFGFGIFGALSVGSTDVDLPGGNTVKHVDETWFTLGARGVLFP